MIPAESAPSAALQVKIDKAEKAVHCAASNIRKLSYFFLASGVVLGFQSVYQLWTARDNAQYIAVHKQLPWGKKKLAVDVDDFTMMPAYELELYEILNMLGYITIGITLMCLLTYKVGRWAKWAAETKKEWIPKCMLGKSVFAFGVFVMLYLASKHEAQQFKAIFDKIKDTDSLDYKAAEFSYLPDY